MKKIMRFLLTLCILIAVSGCNAGSKKIKEDIPSTITPEITEITPETSKITPKVTDNPAQENPETTEGKIHILSVNKQTHSNTKWLEDQAVLLSEVRCATIVLDNEDEKRYPELAEVLLKNEASIKKHIISEEFDYLTELAEQQISEDTSRFTSYLSTYDRQVRRADSIALSILVDAYYFNGVFDSRDFWGENYDTETGKKLMFSDVVTDIDTFAQVAQKQLYRHAGADVFSSDNIITEYFKTYRSNEINWTLDYNGVTVYFTEGEIADYGFGAMNVTVTFAEHPELFFKKYQEVPEAYTVALPVKSTFFTDITGDGACEELTVVDSYEEEFPFHANVGIHTALDSCKEDFCAYSFMPYYVKTADNRHYLYLFAEQDLHMCLSVYDIANGTVKKSGDVNVSPFYSDGIYAIPSNPDRMHFEIFSNEENIGYVSEGNDFFSVGVDGLPAQG